MPRIFNPQGSGKEGIINPFYNGLECPKKQENFSKVELGLIKIKITQALEKFF